MCLGCCGTALSLNMQFVTRSLLFLYYLLMFCKELIMNMSTVVGTFFCIVYVMDVSL